MDDNVYKDKRKNIKVRERQFYTRLKNFKLHDVSLLESSSFDRHLTSMEPTCLEITDQIDEIIIDLQDGEEDNDPRILDIENISNKLLQSLEEAKQELLLRRKKDLTLTSMVKEISIENDNNDQEKEVDQSQGSKYDACGVQNIPNVDIKEAELLTKKKSGQEFGEKIGKKTIKKVIMSEEAGEGIAELVSESPSEIVLELVLGSIGEQLGVKGTSGFFAAALTHYAVGQFAVLIGVATSPIKMDFSGITQAKILKKLEDLNKKVDKIIALPTKQALKYLKDGFTDLKHSDFQEAYNKFTEVRKFATEAISLNEDFKNIAVCTKYLLFADTMTQAFNQEGEAGGPCFLPVEKFSEKKKQKMTSYLSNSIDDLKKRAKTKGRKRAEHRDQLDGVLKMIYNVLSVCKNLSNPNTCIKNEITFGVDTDCVPFGEEDATVLQVGRYVKDSVVSEASIHHLPPFNVYLWRSETVFFVRRERKIFNIPLRSVSRSIVMVKLEKRERLVCHYGENRERFERMADSTAGYPSNIQQLSKLFETAKDAKDMDSLPMPVYAQMQRMPEVYLSDLGIDVNAKNEDNKSLLHYVACLPSTWSNKTAPIDCLVDAGADLDIRDNTGQTPLMAAMNCADAVKETLKTLIDHYEGTSAINAEDSEGNNVLHIAASINESNFTKEIVKLLLKAKADATHLNKDEYNPRDMAHHHQNWHVKEFLDGWLTGNK